MSSEGDEDSGVFVKDCPLRVEVVFFRRLFSLTCACLAPPAVGTTPAKSSSAELWLAPIFRPPSGFERQTTRERERMSGVSRRGRWILVAPVAVGCRKPSYSQVSTNIPGTSLAQLICFCCCHVFRFKGFAVQRSLFVLHRTCHLRGRARPPRSLLLSSPREKNARRFA